MHIYTYTLINFYLYCPEDSWLLSFLLIILYILCPSSSWLGAHITEGGSYTVSSRRQLVSAAIWSITHFLHSQYFKLVVGMVELLLHTWCFLWHFSPLKKTILIRLWKTSSPKSKTVHQKQKKSQGTSEAWGPILAYLTVIKLQVPSVCLLDFWPSAPVLWILVPNILCHCCLPFSNKMGNCPQIVLHRNIWVRHLYFI